MNNEIWSVHQFICTVSRATHRRAKANQFAVCIFLVCVHVTSKAKGLVRSTDCSKAFTFKNDVTWDILETAALKLEILCQCLVWLSLREWRVDRGENTLARLPSLRPNSFRALSKRTYWTENTGNLVCAKELRQNYFTPYSSKPYVLLHICVVLRHVMIFHVTRANILLVSASTLKDSTGLFCIFLVWGIYTTALHQQPKCLRHWGPTSRFNVFVEVLYVCVTAIFLVVHIICFVGECC